MASQKKISILSSNLESYGIPRCSRDLKHENYQLSELCLNPECTEYLLPQCVVCNYSSHAEKKDHDVKPVKQIFESLLTQLRDGAVDYTNAQQKPDETYNRLKEQYDLLVQAQRTLTDVLKATETYMQNFKAFGSREPGEHVELRRIMKDLLLDNNEANLRSKLDDIKGLTQSNGTELLIDTAKSSQQGEEIAQNVEEVYGKLTQVCDNLKPIVESLVDLEKTFNIPPTPLPPTEESIYEYQSFSEEPDVSQNSWSSSMRAPKGYSTMPAMKSQSQQKMEWQPESRSQYVQPKPESKSQYVQARPEEQLIVETTPRLEQTQPVTPKKKKSKPQQSQLPPGYLHSLEEEIKQEDIWRKCVKEEMNAHLKICTNGHCDHVDSPSFIKYSKDKAIKEKTDCLTGKELNNRMEKILARLRYLKQRYEAAKQEQHH